MTRKAYQIRKQRGRRKGEAEYPFYPNHLLRGLIVVTTAAAIVTFLASIFPPSLDRAADPLTGPDPGTQALWVVKPALVLENLFGSKTLTSSAITLIFVLFLLLPVLDRTGHRHLRKRLILAVPFVAIVAWLILSALLKMGSVV
jgi:quinol-cytochrome oxidoreductase complex cytochrome b subunit